MMICDSILRCYETFVRTKLLLLFTCFIFFIFYKLVYIFSSSEYLVSFVLGFLSCISFCQYMFNEPSDSYIYMFMKEKLLWYPSPSCRKLFRFANSISWKIFLFLEPWPKDIILFVMLLF